MAIFDLIGIKHIGRLVLIHILTVHDINIEKKKKKKHYSNEKNEFMKKAEHVMLP